MSENEVFSVDPSASSTSTKKPVDVNDKEMIQIHHHVQPRSDQKGSKEFRFVNNSPNSMVKPRYRMKPTFKVETQSVSNMPYSSTNKESVIIEQTFNKNNTDDKKYVFQLNVKRPPGRPRKHPVVENKVKRPQGRPRKYPIEVSGSSIVNSDSSKVVKKPHEAHIHTSASNPNAATLVASPDQFPIPIDTELALASAAKRGRGRPKRNEKDGKEKGGSTTEAAVAVALNDSEPVNND